MVVAVIFKIILTLIFCLILPLLAITVLIPIYIFRFIISKVGQNFKSDFSKILTASSSIFGSDEIYHGKPSDTIITTCILKGQFELEEFRRLVLNRVINLKNTGNNDLQNPELQQIVTDWMGFLFWKWDRKFDIKHHVRMYQPSSGENNKDTKTSYDIHDLAAIGESLMCQPFTSGKSPWEILLFNNIRPEKTITNQADDSNHEDQQILCGMILHIHHCLVDGFSMLKLLVLDLGQNLELNVAQPSKPKKLTFKKIKKYLCAPYDIIDFNINQADAYSEFHLPTPKLSLTANAAVSTPISLKRLKTIKNSLQDQYRKLSPTLYGIILTAYAEGFRKFMIENQFKLPNKIHIGISLAKSRHPTKLRNHFTTCCVEIPDFDSAMPIQKRLELIEKNILQQKNSIVPDFVFNLVILTGCLFKCMIRSIKSVNQCTAALSNLPGPPTLVNIADKPLVEFFPTVGMPGNVGIGCVCSTYNNNMRLAVRIDESIASIKNLNSSKLIECIINEFDNFGPGYNTV